MEIAFFPMRFFAEMDLVKQRHLNSCLSTLLVLGMLPLLRFVPHLCLMQWVMHIPCPGCGITTGVRDLMSLQFQEAWAANPASYLVGLSFGYQVLCRPFGLLLAEKRSARVADVAKHLSRLTCVALGAVWIVRVI